MRTVEILKGDKWHVLARLKTKQAVNDAIHHIQSGTSAARNMPLRSTTIVAGEHAMAVKYFPIPAN